MSEEPIASAMADCILPEEIMLCILTRLPVKSLLRFKSVCKPWRELFATPKFTRMHHDQFSSDPENQVSIIRRLSGGRGMNMSFISGIESYADEPTNAEKPFNYIYPCSYISLHFVGSCNGLVCTGFVAASSKPRAVGMGVVLWNPALRLSKAVRLREVDDEVVFLVSFGFGYDTEGDEFKVVRIVCTRGERIGVAVEVYSTKSDLLKTISLDFQFSLFPCANDANVNGNPCWFARVEESEGLEHRIREVLLWCDVTKLECNVVPLSSFRLEEGGAVVPFVEWKGSLAALVCSKSEERVESLDVWVFDDGEMMWTKNHTFGPIEMQVNRCLYCSKGGTIMGDCVDGKLFVFDPKTGKAKEIEIREGPEESFRIYGYSESLAYIEGMEQMVVRKEKEEEEEQTVVENEKEEEQMVVKKEKEEEEEEE